MNSQKATDGVVIHADAGEVLLRTKDGNVIVPPRLLPEDVREGDRLLVIGYVVERGVKAREVKS